MAPALAQSILTGLFGSSSKTPGKITKKRRKTSSDGNKSLSSSSASGTVSVDRPCELIADESHLMPLEPAPPSLSELNHSLEALAVIFPDVQIEVFREMLSSFSGESRLAVVTDALLKNQVGWVKGRWRRKEGRDIRADMAQSEAAAATPLVAKSEQFKDRQYVKAVKDLAWSEFKGLSRSSVDAVLAEHNYSYLEARPVLIEMSSKSWRFAVSSLIYRRKAVTPAADADNHPLITWKSSGHGSIVPCLRSTSNAELDREMFETLIAPIQRRMKAAQEQSDRALALRVQEEEAEEVNATLECCCCFSDTIFEEVTSCNVSGHLTCFRCVQLSLKEAVYGQGWQTTIDHASGRLRCPAMEADGCAGTIALDQMQRAIQTNQEDDQIIRKLEQKLGHESLATSGLPLIQCPFCSYAEVDDLCLTRQEQRIKIKLDQILGFLMVVIYLCCMLPSSLLLLIFTPLSLLLIDIWLAPPALHHTTSHRLGTTIRHEFHASLHRHRRRKRGPKFTCQSPSCGAKSCILCHKEWIDIHTCHESSLVALRTQVEQAMSMAIKRVCPRCNTSFVKSAGCNKLTCPCGYKMCYVCRKDIGEPTATSVAATIDADDPAAAAAAAAIEDHQVGYRHFCEHFRPEGDPKKCTECNKCNLWESEDEVAVLKRAKEEVERKWRLTEGRELSGAEAAFLETGVAAVQPGRVKRGVKEVVEDLVVMVRTASVGGVCDSIVERFVV